MRRCIGSGLVVFERADICKQEIEAPRGKLDGRFYGRVKMMSKRLN